MSNIEELENYFGKKGKYAYLHESRYIVKNDGESTLLILASNDEHQFQPAIWGLLPHNYERSWKFFQSIVPSTCIQESDLHEQGWCSNAVRERRCLIPVTGFYTNYVSRGDTLTYHLGLKNNEPFYLGGIYNITDDGFLNFAILTKRSSELLRTYQNTTNQVPVIVENEFVNDWLKGGNNGLGIYQNSNLEEKLIASSIPTDLYLNGITYDSMFAKSHSNSVDRNNNSFFFES